MDRTVAPESQGLPESQSGGGPPPVPHVRGVRRAFRMPRPVRRLPLVPLALYYGSLALAWSALGAWLPMLTGEAPAAAAVPSELTALVAMSGALALMAPVVSVYMRTRRLRYDASLVHSLIILPVVTAGIFLVIENSLARAFSLAGIMAAVRFRNTLQETRDIVYILLGLGIGLAAGAGELGVAAVMSAGFNLLVLVLWGFNVGSIYAAGSARRGILSVGEPRLVLGTSPAARTELRRGLLDRVRGFRPDGAVLVHTPSAAGARSIVEEVLFESTREWHRAGRVPNPQGVETLAYLVKLRKREARPAELLGSLEECSVQVRAAEYLPLSPDAVDGHRHGGKHGRRHERVGREERTAADEEE